MIMKSLLLFKFTKVVSLKNFSVISLFALALERVKSKMKSMVKKKSAEILMSVAEGIQFQLQTAQHQIQADM